MARREFSDAEKGRFADERREQLEQWQERLADQVTQLTSGDEWRRWLEVASRFTSYSFRNSLMILMQRPDATTVAGYRAWQTSFGRQVNKSEVGIKIFAPVTRLEVKLGADGRPVVDGTGRPVKESRLVGFRLTSVFDVSQTSGPPLPVQPVPELLTGEAPVGLWDGLQRFVEAQGFQVRRGDCGGANGVTFFGSGEVRVRADIDDAAAVKTLAHEAGHVLLHGGQVAAPGWLCRGSAEVEAESVAYLVTRAHGLDSSQYTFNYVAGWADQALVAAPVGTTLTDIVARTGGRVVCAADTILAATQPPRLIDQLTDLLVTNTERSIRLDRGNELATRSRVRPEPQHSRQLLLGVARSVGSVAR